MLTTSPDPRAVSRGANALRRDDFFYFLWKVFLTLHAGGDQDFDPAWHVEAMCHELGHVRTGETRRLVINVPPRCLKSITVSVAFAAFVLGHRPETRIIVASYGLDLARKHSEDCHRILVSAWYQQLFPATRLADRGNTVEEFRTTKGGGRKAVSIGSSVTGHGAEIIIIDDLLKAGDANSPAERERAQDFIEGTLLSRFDNPKEGRVVMIAQRLHEMDPAGYLLSKGTYRHLNLPAIAEADEIVDLGHGRQHRRTTGEPLFPKRLNLKTLDRIRREMGPAVFNCQYQQNPIAPEGSVLRWEWFGTYDEGLPRNRYQLVVQSWDTGMSSDPRADFSVCTTWGYRDSHWHLLDVFRGQLDYHDLKKKTLQLIESWTPDRVLIEDAATGKPLFDELSRDNRRCFSRIRPEHDKEVRFNAVCALVEEGKVLLPREASWLRDFKRELQSFPRGRNDDQVDSFSQLLNWSKGHSFLRALPYDDPLRKARRERPTYRLPARRTA